MFEIGDKLRVNLGKNGTFIGELVSEENGGQKLLVVLEDGRAAAVSPWDVFLIDDERTE